MAAVALWTTAADPAAVRAQDGAAPMRLLDVPFLPQSEALCGGAAAAMVMRFWGATAVYPDSFAHLVDAEAGGIRGQDLMAALVSRNWQVVSFAGDSASVRAQLAARHPIVALIEDRPDRFHYVVIVGWVDGRVIAHDPARAPFRVYPEREFVKAWAASGSWALIVLPGEAADDLAESAKTAETERVTSCTPVVTEAVRLAGNTMLAEAEQLLQFAIADCPTDAAPWRELAGVSAVRAEWRDAAARAREALKRNPADDHAARILGTSLFLQDDVTGALDAWNALNEPRIDLIEVVGLARTRHDAVQSVLKLQQRSVLTANELALARRRLSELPAAMTTRLSYKPVEDGRASVEAVIVERPFIPRGAVSLAAIGAKAAIDRELTFPVSSVTGGGEVLTASWRWWERRPRVALALTTPAPRGWPGGVWRLEAFGEHQTYETDRVVEEHRRGASLEVSEWVSSSMRIHVSAGLDRWRAQGTSARAGGGLERHAAGDRLIFGATGSLFAGSIQTAVLSAHGTWRSKIRNEGTVWLASGGITRAGTTSPRAVWPGAGTGHGRDAPLRAHPLLEDGVVRDGVFGRSLAHGSVEWRQWYQPGMRPWRVAPAVFADIARAWRTDAGFDSRLHVDVGIGVRLALPASGVLRVDAGRGLRDGRMALSFTWSARL